MSETLVDLRPRRELIDANFDGYKLTLDSLPLYRLNFSGGVDEVKLSEDQYSLQHIKAFGIHNHLISDPWNPNVVFFVAADWQIKKVIVHVETSLEAPAEVLQLPDSADRKLRSDRHNATVHFVDAEWALIADGTGRLLVVHTGDRTQDGKWKICFCENPLDGERNFTLVGGGIMQSDNESISVSCVLLHVEKSEPKEEEKNSKPFVTELNWLKLVSEDRLTWTVERERRLEGFASPDYVALDREGAALVVATERPFKLTLDSAKPLQEPKQEKHRKMEPPKPAYVWMQTEEEVSVSLHVPENTCKSDVLFKLTSDNIQLGIKNSDMLLKGCLHAAVDVENSTWTLDDKQLEVTLFKESPGAWPIVVVGDTRGQLVLDEAQRQRVHEQLAHLTSDTWNPDSSEDAKPAYNSEELEECDALPDDGSAMQRFDGETHQVTHQVNLGSHQWLFNTRASPDKPLAICLRHDVDGVVWQPSDDVTPKQPCWDHIATFNAFGYVQASKRQRKFTSCPSDFSYVALCDSVRHVYVYWQPTPTLSPLRNRKTGREVSAVAKQQVVSIESTDTIEGMHATNERLFVLTSSVLYVVRMKTD